MSEKTEAGQTKLNTKRPRDISIADAAVGTDSPCFVIAEVAQSHDGSLGLAHAFIDAAAQAGADAIKFQTHIAMEESTLDEPFRVKFSKQDETRYDYWKRMEFSPEQWAGLASHANEAGLIFLSSAFSVRAVGFLDSIGMPAWKVGSGEFASWPLIGAMIETGKPILYSTGMSRSAEISEAASTLREHRTPHALFQCTSAYPTPLDKVGLNVIDDLRAEFGCPVGLSDHSGTPFPAFAAIARGVDLLEVHITFDRKMFGPDVVASVDMAEFRQIMEFRNAYEVMKQNPVDKDVLAEELSAMRGIFSKSLAPVAALPKGTILLPEHLTTKKPGTGIAENRAEEFIGKKLIRDITPDRLLSEKDVE